MADIQDPLCLDAMGRHENDQKSMRLLALRHPADRRASAEGVRA
ncbi:hypothetical protein [Acidihalobacter prosperus]